MQIFFFCSSNENRSYYCETKTLQFDKIFFLLIWHKLFFFTAGRFDEDGSFIGQYGTLQRRQQEQLLQQQMQQQELGIKQGGGTYVWNTVLNPQTTKPLSCDIMMNFFTFLCFNCLILLSHFFRKVNATHYCSPHLIKYINAFLNFSFFFFWLRFDVFPTLLLYGETVKWGL